MRRGRLHVVDRCGEAWCYVRVRVAVSLHKSVACITEKPGSLNSINYKTLNYTSNKHH